MFLKWVAIAVVCVAVLFVLWHVGRGIRIFHNVVKQHPPKLSKLLGQTHRFPIDLVVTWVDSSDAHWQAQLRAITQKPEASRYPNPQESSREIRLAIKSYRRFAPWLRCIILVTQRPQTLPDLLTNVGVPVRVVHHDEFFEDPSALPVFNSHAIEANLARIPGLAEHFLYSNDDMYMTSNTFPEDFFSKAGDPIVGATLTMPFFTRIGNSGYKKAWRNLRQTLFPYDIMCFSPDHMLLPLRVSTIKKTVAQYSQVFSTTGSRKLRNDEGQIPPIGFVVNQALLSGKARHDCRKHILKLYCVPQLTMKNGYMPKFITQYQATLPAITTCINNVEHLDYNLERVAELLLENPGFRQHRALIVVAHPDDETIFGAPILLGSSHVMLVLLSHSAQNGVRRREFDRVVSILEQEGHQVQCLYYDLLDGKKINMQFKDFQFPEEAVARARDWKPDAVYGHGADGEYGHKNHIHAHRHAKSLARELGVGFHSFQGVAIPKGLAFEGAQNRLLAVYFARPNLLRHVRKWKSKNNIL